MTDFVLPDGYRLVPGNAVFAVNENGSVFSTRLGRTVTISKQKTGYRTVAYRENDKTKTFYVHRLVAMTFIPVPEEMVNPEVNHKDGNKDNNYRSNLEWVTSVGNKKHAIESGLFEFRKVRAHHWITGRSHVFNSCEEAARAFAIRPKSLKKHLDSDLAGKLTKDWWVFIYDDMELPEMTDEEFIRDRWYTPRGLWVVVKDNKRYIASTLELACEGLGLKYFSIQPEVRADGKEYVVQGYTFYYSNLPSQEMIDKARYSDKKTIFRRVTPLKVTFHNACDAVQTFDSLRKAARALNIADTTILYALRRKKGKHLHYTFEYV